MAGGGPPGGYQRYGQPLPPPLQQQQQPGSLLMDVRVCTNIYVCVCLSRRLSSHHLSTPE